ncbi:response regulator transcription factor [Flaviaesturariibacter aridisoli]|uniref:Response regulator transcription factor n=2 Tax=Flaviaesturariibacter aridisoli TaxID=2545761 RepID=A0A4R4DU45_9BACT|nr:response regulator transcription factor [Flaviaesturariibacter aridisoli]
MSGKRRCSERGVAAAYTTIRGEEGTMTNIVIIEDQSAGTGLLQGELRKLAGEMELDILACPGSVAAAVEWFRAGGQPDLVLCNTELADGHAFHLFSQVPVPAPVIFVTPYDPYVLQSFEYNGIHYLLKPVLGAELRQALRKFEWLRARIVPGSKIDPSESRVQRRHSRIIVQRGMEQVALPLADVVLFYTENKVVFVVDRHGNKYLYEGVLQTLEAELDPAQFFRANRQFLIHIDYVHSFRSMEKSRLRVQMDIPAKGYEIIVSQETAARFRRWIEA